MLKATLVCKLEAEAKNGRGSTVLSANTNVGDVKLKASITNALAPSLALSLEKPSSFSVGYYYSPKKVINNVVTTTLADCDQQGEGDLPNLKFKFADSVKVMGRKVSLAYSHELQERKMTVDGLMELNEENKVAVSHVVGTKDCKLRYTLARRKLVVEPAYNFKDRAWVVVMSRSFDSGNVMRGSYEAKNRKLELEWSRTFTDKGSFKVLC